MFNISVVPLNIFIKDTLEILFYNARCVTIANMAVADWHHVFCLDSYCHLTSGKLFSSPCGEISRTDYLFEICSRVYLGLGDWFSHGQWQHWKQSLQWWFQCLPVKWWRTTVEWGNWGMTFCCMVSRQSWSCLWVLNLMLESWCITRNGQIILEWCNAKRGISVCWLLPSCYVCEEFYW